MKKVLIVRLAAGLLGLLGMFLAVGTAGRQAQSPPDQETDPQQIQKPTYDYMSSYLSRSTRPLGLNVDPLARELLSQESVKWAVRTGLRHALD